VDTVLAWSRGREVSAQRFLQLALVSLGSLYVVVATGAVVRLTASGLGCENWPRCGDKPFPEKGGHAFIEFGNRIVALAAMAATLVAWLAARRVRGLDGRVRWAAFAVFAGTVAQIPLGGLTVIFELHPLLVMAHFLLAFVVLAVSVVVALEAWSERTGLGAPVGPTWWRRLATVGVPAGLALVVTGAIATASGPHSGGEDIRRLGVEVADAVYVHVRATAVYGIGLVLVGAYLWRRRREHVGIARLGLVLLGILLAQMLVGEVQYRNAVPWWLVLLHVVLSALIWTLTVAIVWVLWRPPVALTAVGSRPRQ
jgi:heme a synthase